MIGFQSLEPFRERLDDDKAGRAIGLYFAKVVAEAGELGEGIGVFGFELAELSAKRVHLGEAFRQIGLQLGISGLQCGSCGFQVGPLRFEAAEVSGKPVDHGPLCGLVGFQFGDAKGGGLDDFQAVRTISFDLTEGFIQTINERLFSCLILLQFLDPFGVCLNQGQAERAILFDLFQRSGERVGMGLPGAKRFFESWDAIEFFPHTRYFAHACGEFVAEIGNEGEDRVELCIGATKLLAQVSNRTLIATFEKINLGGRGVEGAGALGTFDLELFALGAQRRLFGDKGSAFYQGSIQTVAEFGVEAGSGGGFGDGGISFPANGDGLLPQFGDALKRIKVLTRGAFFEAGEALLEGGFGVSHILKGSHVAADDVQLLRAGGRKRIEAGNFVLAGIDLPLLRIDGVAQLLVLRGKAGRFFVDSPIFFGQLLTLAGDRVLFRFTGLELAAESVDVAYTVGMPLVKIRPLDGEVVHGGSRGLGCFQGHSASHPGKRFEDDRIEGGLFAREDRPDGVQHEIYGDLFHTVRGLVRAVPIAIGARDLHGEHFADARRRNETGPVATTEDSHDRFTKTGGNVHRTGVLADVSTAEREKADEPVEAIGLCRHVDGVLRVFAHSGTDLGSCFMF